MVMSSESLAPGDRGATRAAPLGGCARRAAVQVAWVDRAHVRARAVGRHPHLSLAAPRMSPPLFSSASFLGLSMPAKTSATNASVTRPLHSRQAGTCCPKARRLTLALGGRRLLLLPHTLMVGNGMKSLRAGGGRCEGAAAANVGGRCDDCDRAGPLLAAPLGPACRSLTRPACSTRTPTRAPRGSSPAGGSRAAGAAGTHA